MKIPVFVYVDYSKGPNPPGDGDHHLVACFIDLKVHVSFTIYCHSENDYLKSVETPVACDGHHGTGSIQDFGKERHHTDYSVERIIKAASDYVEGRRSQKKMKEKNL